jgi:hypothetical protein
MRATRSSAASTTSGADAGAGLLGSVVGVAVFLVLLLFAVQVTLNLYVASAVTGAAFDAARVVAGSAGGDGSIAAAEADARELLGRFEDGGGRLDFAWVVSDEAVAVTVRARRPSLLPGLPFPFDEVERTVRVRREAVR